MEINPNLINRILIHNPFQWDKPMTYLAWCIRKIRKNDWNHEAIFINGYVYEASWRIKKILFDKWLNSAIRTTVIIPIYTNVNLTEPAIGMRSTGLEIYTPRTQNEMYLIAEAELGKFYNVQNTFIWQLIKSLTGKWVGRTQTWAYDTMNCSEFVAYVIGFPKAYMAAPGDNI